MLRENKIEILSSFNGTFAGQGERVCLSNAEHIFFEMYSILFWFLSLVVTNSAISWMRHLLLAFITANLYFYLSKWYFNFLICVNSPKNTSAVRDPQENSLGQVFFIPLNFDHSFPTRFSFKVSCLDDDTNLFTAIFIVANLYMTFLNNISTFWSVWIAQRTLQYEILKQTLWVNFFSFLWTLITCFQLGNFSNETFIALKLVVLTMIATYLQQPSLLPDDSVIWYMTAYSKKYLNMQEKEASKSDVTSLLLEHTYCIVLNT